jgi:hypothetical protein
MKYRDGYDGQVAEDEIFILPEILWPKEPINEEFITVSITGLMVIKSGYAWDYATVPLTHWISNKIGGKKTKTPSLGHDALCQLKRIGLLPMDPTRIHTDTYFYTLLLKRKFWKVRAWAWFKAVRIGAKYHKQKPKEVLYAP